MTKTTTGKKRLDALVREQHGVSWTRAREWIATGKIWISGAPATDPALELGRDASFELKMNAPRTPRATSGVREDAKGGKDFRGVWEVRELQASQVVFTDSQLVIVDKPAGINTVPYDSDDPSEPPSLDRLAARAVGQARLIVVHRIDRETSGLVAFARTREAGDALSEQFRRHTVTRRYFAVAHGRVDAKTIRSNIVANRGDGLRGSVEAARGARVPRPDAKTAVTHVRPLLELAGATLIECRLETGRTHQIRIHLAEDGHPLLGEKAYDRRYDGPKLPAPRILLHAGALGLTHPTRDTRLIWRSPPPADFLELVGAAGQRAIQAALGDVRS